MSIEELSGTTLDMIVQESESAQLKHGWANTPFSPEQDRGVKLAILMEEVGEVANHICEAALGKNVDPNELVKELIQVASVAAGWAQSENFRFPEPVPGDDASDDDPF